LPRRVEYPILLWWTGNLCGLVVDSITNAQKQTHYEIAEDLNHHLQKYQTKPNNPLAYSIFAFNSSGISVAPGPSQQNSAVLAVLRGRFINLIHLV
jgi:hypothetical protein